MKNLIFGLLLTMAPVVATASDTLTVYSDGYALLHGKVYNCAVGFNGVAEKEMEGDGKTPPGVFSINSVFYRADRIKGGLKTNLSTRVIQENFGWCDDSSAVEYYNKFVILPCSHSHEKLWRKDHLYDLVVVIGYNSAAIPGKGSAIFLHIARIHADGSYGPTAGCIGFKRKDLLEILGRLSKECYISIKTEKWHNK